jgi:HNH endonuclease
VKRTVNTPHSAIFDYWFEHGPYEGDMGCDWSDALTCCWRCGLDDRTLERCHIIPHQAPFNGPDTPSNLVLLCRQCHREAPCCDDPGVIWAWIKRTHSTFAGSIWAERLRDAIERETGKTSEELFDGIDLEAFLPLYKTVRESRSGAHPGDSTATMVWALQQTLKELRSPDTATISHQALNVTAHTETLRAGA